MVASGAMTFDQIAQKNNCDRSLIYGDVGFGDDELN